MNSDNAICCAICGYSDNLLRCSRCKLIFYCSKDHQKKHWKKHKVDCETSTEKSDKGKETSENKDSPYIRTTTKTPNTSPKTLVASSPLLSTPTTYSPASSGRSSLKNSPKTPLTTPNKSLESSGRSSFINTSGEFCETSKQSSPSSVLPSQGSSEVEILGTDTQRLDLSPDILKYSTLDILKTQSKDNMPINSKKVVIPPRPEFKDFPESSLHPPYLHKTPSDDMIKVVIEDMNAYGLCVLDNFCGSQLGKAALEEFLNMYNKGIFQDGQLVAKSKNDAQSIRSDKIMWFDGKEDYCKNIGQVLNRIDNLIMKANKSPNNGKLGQYNINGRTKAMLAVYPGSGTHYVKHVDNPNNDGRCVTAIYYLNVNWDVQKNGGLLRIFPECARTTVADIAPLFDRLLFFWSDRQNPHEVQPTHNTRYAITLWYFDATERALATKRFELEQKTKRAALLQKNSETDQTNA
ncbi:hypothetical protein WA026_011689 [Henosepilachna vigintioctopunctata]|uniref:hypoxia-inducible factor-proline dioxygenase n=1 Tax=Henosepilachna vigintioctopunctata TaxID=420089 RepID=A0AAW1UIW0_9CUCU